MEKNVVPVKILLEDVEGGCVCTMSDDVGQVARAFGATHGEAVGKAGKKACKALGCDEVKGVVELLGGEDSDDEGEDG